MRPFLPKQPRTEAEIETLLVPLCRMVRFPGGALKKLEFPRVVWDAHDYAVSQGMQEEELVEFSLRHSRDSGFPFELAYSYMAHFVARLYSE